MKRPPRQAIAADVRRALEEDLGDGDRTASLIPPATALKTRVISREAAVLAGRPWFSETFRQVQGDILIHWRCEERSLVRYRRGCIAWRGWPGSGGKRHQ